MQAFFREIRKNKSMLELTENDHQQLKELGINQDKMMRYLEIFKKGISFSEVRSAANINQGIEAFSEEQLQGFVNKYDSATDLEVVKFTPASGAATRMFKAMHQLMKDANSVEKFASELQKHKYEGLLKMANQLDKLPFYEEITTSIENFENYNQNEQAYQAFQLMLSENGLGLDQLPKGLIQFHNYKKKTVSAFEEHFYEAAAYASKEGKANLHFTISEEHQTKFETAFKEIDRDISTETGVEFQVSFSFQKKSTDTLAVDLQNKPFRLGNGKLLFRPGGHGALIENLNEVDADLIFIKNIDNISHRNNLDSNAYYKKALAGFLLVIQQKSFEFIEALQNNPTQETIEKATDFLQNTLNVDQDLKEVDSMIAHLNKPIRVCGMVKNEGEPGGGPYWMVNGKGNTSLQIVEKSQIDLDNPQQENILTDATHFNPVDLVCAVRNYKKEKFNLLEYVNPNRGFITEKSLEGKTLKALELPGLWNGAMEYWNTIFVEVPSSTFCPVKSVSDLLKPLHLVGKLEN
jgi:uncharacterized pyridoxal phosphate-containing UPF0001 family protein